MKQWIQAILFCTVTAIIAVIEYLEKMECNVLNKYLNQSFNNNHFIIINQFHW